MALSDYWLVNLLKRQVQIFVTWKYNDAETLYRIRGPPYH